MGIKVSSCIHQDGYHVDLYIYRESLLRQWSGKKLFCPICGSKLIYRHGVQKAAHFAHASVCTYPYYEPETEEHLKGKQLVKKWLKSLYPDNITQMEYYVKEAKQRADVISIFPDGHSLCVEVQCSPITEETWRKRYTEYKKANVSQLWLIGSKLLEKSHLKFAKIKLNQFLKAVYHELKRKLFIIDIDKGQLMYLSNVVPYKSSKTIFTCKDVWVKELLETKISKWGVIHTENVELMFERRKKREEQLKKNQERWNTQLVECMKPWTDPAIYEFHKKMYRKKILEHPVKQFLNLYYELDRPNISVLFDQPITGDQVFKIDHRLWQAYLFFTEIYQVYRRSSRYDSGMITPKLFVKNIVYGSSRVPYRPFMQMIESYINRSLLKAKKFDPITFDSILTVHEVIYEYFDRLTHLGFLRNISPSKEIISSSGKVFGRFEVLFDRFYPEWFHSEENIREFFRNHKLQYKWKKWCDAKSGKNFP